MRIFSGGRSRSANEAQRLHAPAAPWLSASLREGSWHLSFVKVQTCRAAASGPSLATLAAVVSSAPECTDIRCCRTAACTSAGVCAVASPAHCSDRASPSHITVRRRACKGDKMLQKLPHHDWRQPGRPAALQRAVQLPQPLLAYPQGCRWRGAARPRAAAPAAKAVPCSQPAA